MFDSIIRKKDTTGGIFRDICLFATELLQPFSVMTFDFIDTSFILKAYFFCLLNLVIDKGMIILPTGA